MEPQEKRDMREGRAAEEILYVVMCVIISFLIVAELRFKSVNFDTVRDPTGSPVSI
jgi:hypothetical protein